MDLKTKSREKEKGKNHSMAKSKPADMYSQLCLQKAMGSFSEAQ